MEAKNNNDFASFAPYVEKLVDYTKRFACYYNDKDKPFNVILDDYQEGLNMETLDKFFGEVKKSVVPLNEYVATSKKLQKVKEIKERIESKTYDIDIQKKLVNNLFMLQGLDPTRCKISESEHPFTSGANSNDIRYTVNYREDKLASTIYSGLHEGGHAMYQLNINNDFDYTSIYDGASMSMHESQSRIYENNIGRSYEFSKHILKEIKKLFPKQFEDVSEEDFYLYSNYSSPSLIRVEADELTYSLHIMVRYQIEKMIFEDGIDVMELPAIWNKLYKEYLGVTPPNDTKGILQDVHWSFGLFGYFPTYALGTAYSAQFEATMKRIFDYEAELRSGNLTKITEWLNENVHKYGKLYKDEKIIKMATGEEFNPSYYTKYLDEKYRKIYS
jgi:carboxypeptidase Taq